MKPIFFTVRYSFWQRIPRFIEILFSRNSNLPIKQAWHASRVERHIAFWGKK